MQKNSFGKAASLTLLLLLLTGTSLFAGDRTDSGLSLSEALHQISEKYEVIITFNDKHVAEIRTDFTLQEGEAIEPAINRALLNTDLKYKQLTVEYFVVYHAKETKLKSLTRLKKKFEKIQDLEKKEGLVVQRLTNGKTMRLKQLNGPVEPVPARFLVKGMVSDEAAVPLIGVTILEKGTSSGTVTDIDGKFELSVTDENASLEVSYIGYQRKTIAVAGRSELNISLAVEAASLESVVVVGYGTLQKQELTSSVVTVREEDFTQGANYNAVQLLNGAASGVNVTQTSSAPGADLKVQIRGAGSINSGNGVLFVVDGLPGIDPNSLSPGDIESIDVLKDASAAAIYGTRAANGVVLITTKRGQSGKPSLSYGAYYGTQTVAKTLDVLGARDYADLINLRAPGTYTPDQINGFGAGTDWQSQIFDSAPVQNHQLSVSGGNPTGNYYLGLNYFDQDGIVKTSGTKKYNIRLNVESKPFDKLTVRASANYTYQTFEEILSSNEANEGAGPINSALQFDPTLSTDLDENGRYRQNATISMDNPLALLYGIDNPRSQTRFYASLNADYKIINDLTATVRVGAESNGSRNDFYNSRVTTNGFANGGIGNVSFGESTHWLAEALLNYKRNFNGVHDFSLLGGVTFEEFLSSNLSGSSRQFLSDVTGTDLLQSGDGDANDNVSTGRNKNQLNGIISRMTYGFKNKYLLTASVRVDGSSRFAEGNKYAVFPSASVGWRVSQESFMAGSNLIDDLKIRVGYGELGNQAIGNFETRQTLIAQGNAVFGGRIEQGVRPARLPNPNLTWETTREVNFGIDYAIADYLVTGSIDLFSRNTSDQLFQKPLPSVVGFTSVRTNLGSVRNSGVDFNVRTRNIRKENLNWSTNLTMSFLKNEVTELPEFTEEIISGGIGTFITQFNIVREGVALRALYGYEIDGIFQTGDDIAGSATPGALPGEPRFVDQDGDGDVDPDDRVILGDPFPDFTFGLNNTLQVSNFSLEVLLLGVQGIETLDANVVESLYPTNNARNSISRYYEDRWTESNPSNELPSGINPSRYGGGRAINTLTVVDASFIRLKNITLGYDFSLGTNSALKALRLYAAVDNLATFTKYEGFDPEASATGSGSVATVAYNSYPLARTYRFGIDVKF